jgi:translocation and assembly module TamA
MRARFLVAAVVCALATTHAAADTPYAVDITVTGSRNGDLGTALDGASQLVALKDRPPPSLAALRRRAEDDLPRLDGVMKAAGYWQAKAAYRLDEAPGRAHVVVTVTPGPLFHLGTIAFMLPSGAPAVLPGRDATAAIGLAAGAPALSAPIEAANARLVALYAQNGRPFAAITDRRVVVDVATATVSVTYVIDPGAPARFGATAITGLRHLDPDFVTRRVAWREGQAYDERQVESTRQDLLRSGLFGAVNISHAAVPDAAGSLAMTIDLTEAPPHSVGAGVGYNTNIGAGTRAFWEDRNLFGEGEDLRLSAGAAQRQLGVAANFRRPDFLVRKQDLVTDAELLHETTDAYRSRRERFYVGVEEQRWEHYTVGAGMSLERAYLTETSRDENYLLLGTPLFVRRDTTNDLLDPTKGTRGTVTVTPYHGLLANALDFVSARIEDRIYLSLGASEKYVFAGYGALGSIVGASLEGLPADKRLYAGGAGSVRGYGYQRAGPIDASNVPVGGRSSVEFGGELRARITETIGIVPFFDAGNVFASTVPDKASLLYSVGIGARYYTAIGPLRLDLAVPLKKRPGDSAIQVYISIGQAF